MGFDGRIRVMRAPLSDWYLRKIDTFPYGQFHMEASHIGGWNLIATSNSIPQDIAALLCDISSQDGGRFHINDFLGWCNLAGANVTVRTYRDTLPLDWFVMRELSANLQR